MQLWGITGKEASGDDWPSRVYHVVDDTPGGALRLLTGSGLAGDPPQLHYGSLPDDGPGIDSPPSAGAPITV